MIVEVMPGLARSVEVGEPRRCQPSPISGTEPYAPVHNAADIQALEIPTPVECDPIIVQGEVERTLVLPPEPILVLAGEGQGALADLLVPPPPQVDWQENPIAALQRGS